ncbi:hypothetical protein [Desulfosporosinus nitroreducens]|nr:hypothetical protein [Desulfosporosinus nitroreducens]
MFKILVVEDDVNSQKLICAVLKRGGYNAYGANRCCVLTSLAWL